VSVIREQKKNTPEPKRRLLGLFSSLYSLVGRGVIIVSYSSSSLCHTRHRCVILIVVVSYSSSLCRTRHRRLTWSSLSVELVGYHHCRRSSSSVRTHSRVVLVVVRFVSYLLLSCRTRCRRLTWSSLSVIIIVVDRRHRYV
jgi:hypothetical protein